MIFVAARYMISTRNTNLFESQDVLLVVVGSS